MYFLTVIGNWLIQPGYQSQRRFCLFFCAFHFCLQPRLGSSWQRRILLSLSHMMAAEGVIARRKWRPLCL